MKFRMKNHTMPTFSFGFIFVQNARYFNRYVNVQLYVSVDLLMRFMHVLLSEFLEHKFHT